MTHPLLFLVPALVCGGITALGMCEVVRDYRNGVAAAGMGDAFGTGATIATLLLALAATIISLLPPLAWALGGVL